MISAPDRQSAVKLIDEAHRRGARWVHACGELGIDVRYQRWTRGGGIQADGRPDAERPPPANKLSAEERAQVLRLCHAPAYASLPPGVSGPRLC